MDRFHQALPAVLTLVNDALRIGAESGDDGLLPQQLEFLRDAQPYFGQTLAAVYEFGISDVLEMEMGDLARACAGRGLGVKTLRLMLRAWIIALHGVLKTPEVRTLAQPLEWLDARIEKICGGLRLNDPLPDDGQSEFVQALLDNRKDDALALAQAALKKRSLDFVINRLLMPALAEVGRLWSDNTITVADEHLASANASWVAGRLMSECSQEPSRKKLVAIACVPGDFHSIGSEMLARYLECRGWQALYLGASMPQPDMIVLLQQRRPFAVVISIRMAAYLPAFKGLTDALRANLPGLLVLGGGPERIEPVLSRMCDGVARDFAGCLALLEGGRKHA